MYRILPVLFFVLISLSCLAQTDGINYQAVILDPDPRGLPGRDAESNILPNANVSLRFTIIDDQNIEEYQEVQHTQTDPFGMVNLLIGQGIPTNVGTGDFTLIDWDGTEKNLQVDIDFQGSGDDYVSLDRQRLTFVPYAYHRNITAAGSLSVDDITDLNSELRVGGPANLRSVLNVEGDSHLEQRLTVDKTTNLNDSLNVNNGSPAYMSGDLTVDGTTGFNGGLNVQGQITLDSDSIGDENTFENYPLQIRGSNLGMAIMVNGERSIDNNYISFYDSATNQIWGRIEGISDSELESDQDFLREKRTKAFEIVMASADAAIFVAELFQESTVELTAAASSTTACAGVGACVTLPIPSLIVSTSLDVLLKIANGIVGAVNLVAAIEEEVHFLETARSNVGVSYQSGAGDYAEWLQKEDFSESFVAGEIVGITNGKVSKDPWGAEKVMIVSTNPIVLGNMPQPNEEANSVKIAFMGQVPARIIGTVSPGDYVLPSELGNGFGRAVHPDDMQTRDYKKVAGVAWNLLSEITPGVSLVNVAVGINTNDLSEVVYNLEQQLLQIKTEYDQLQGEFRRTHHVLSELIPGFEDAIEDYRPIQTSVDPMKLRQTMFPAVDTVNANRVVVGATDNKKFRNTGTEQLSNNYLVYNSPDDILYFEISEEQIETSIEIARENYQAMLETQNQFNRMLSFGKENKQSNSGSNLRTLSEASELPLIPIDEHPFWQKIDSNPAYKKEIVHFVKSCMEHGMHTHRKYADQFTDLKLKQ